MSTGKQHLPGVVVQFAPQRRPIEPVGSWTAGFVGVAPLPDADVGRATAIFSWRDFALKFGRAADPAPGSAVPPFTALAHAVNGFFLNGGKQCYVVNIGNEADEAHRALQAGLEALAGIGDIAIVAAPGFTDSATYEALRLHCEANARMAILDGPEQITDDVLAVIAGDRKTSEAGWSMPKPSPSGHITLYIPRLRVANLTGAEPVSAPAPPSGYVAGIWARSELERGVHKAPANEVVRGAIGLERHITQAEHEEINAAGVNVIREFPQRGILVWGARTLTNDPEWRYVSVRRTGTMLQQSIARGTRWVVFEPNNEPLWDSIRNEVGAFLAGLWRDGALPGNTPEEAFFVRCDATTNTPESIAAGDVILMVGAALLRPGEFHIFRVVQSRTGCKVEEA